MSPLAASTAIFGVFWAFIEATVDGTPAFRDSWARGVLIFAGCYLLVRLASSFGNLVVWL